MIVEVRPGSVVNKGGELMLRAIVAEIGSTHSLAAEPWIGPYAIRARQGLHQKLWVRRLGGAARLPSSLLPRRIKEMFGIVGEDDIGAVLDASGFRYTDNDDRGPRSTSELAVNTERWRRQGKRIILLPQAIGPFESPDVRKPFLKAFEHIDLLYARDRTSWRHLETLGVDMDRVRLVPDFTVTLKGTVPPHLESFGRDKPVGLIVPNDRMTERTETAVAAAYPGFLASCVAAISALGMEPVIVLHETRRDSVLVNRLERDMRRTLRVINEPDPLDLKGILGRGKLVISSRFHALVSALSQGVPSLATGWSHKYEELLADFGTPDALLDVRTDAAALRARIAALVEPSAAATRSETLLRRTAEQRTRVDTMWDEVRHALDTPAPIAGA